MAIKEYFFTTNTKQQPKVAEDFEAKSTLIIRLILLNPGVYQTHPKMGVGLVSKWRYMDIDDLPKLQAEINQQMQEYLPLEVYYSMSVTVSESTTENRMINLVITDKVTEESKTLKLNEDNWTLSDLV